MVPNSVVGLSISNTCFLQNATYLRSLYERAVPVCNLHLGQVRVFSPQRLANSIALINDNGTSR